MLIENKINASLQPNQVERYYKRGQFRVDQGNWDSYTVCLLAPERYVSRENEAEFDSVIHYEAVLDQLENLPHDSAGFFQTVIASTEQKSSTTDTSGVLRTVVDYFQSEMGIPELEQTVDYKKRIGFRSSHPQHPDAVQYDVCIADTGDSGRTEIRLQFVDTENLPDEKREALESFVAQHIGSLPGYEEKLHRKKNIAVRSIPHDEAVQDGAHDSYPVAIAEELCTLTGIFHPLFVRSAIE